ncbi:DUF342 domain-containing protein [Vibrio fluvialis]|uniref:DUF342 domain-containing protein n=1 Tax=Vibrio fluvialis TaxID=676 RepID=UPI00192B0B77|nr:FapA family protein [Vibrio fluvialis]MBL4240421.1 DUF342 domain-containing protein [Vibrio fluvialis]MBL4267296.1 DUF342 domain-containing protein [Vibrio fluvialis]MBL4271693.1 DUF342 domain-containing protein [Vibrio fluvialis]MBL4276033.1 DUF342 domain-containing protein [Vibrio fluvialis]MBO1442973.1 DUF342 domain-containing protein [Vibrio fluvialis]
MWKDFITLSENKKSVVAQLPAGKEIDKTFSAAGLAEALAEIGARKYRVLDDSVTRFINCARELKGEAYEGIVVAEMRNAVVEVVLSEQDMLASMVVTGAYGGRGLHGSELVHALAQSHVIKGINKLALKKVLLMSNTLKPGEIFTQPVAQGKEAVQGQDAQFIPLVDDVTKRVLAPKERKSNEKIDMRNLGETITVGENEAVMRRKPATKGEPGFTVQGKIIPPKPGNDSALVAGKGTIISPDDPNLLLASQSGMPIIKGKTIDVDNALCLNNVSVATGHVKFKGCVVIAGDVEPGMIVRATGSVTIGGFVESADVQAQGDIEVGKGIIGHTVTDGEDKSCVVKSGGSIKANYAQYSALQASENIQLAVHSMSNDVRCGADLIVLDGSEKQGTLSGGSAKVGGKIVCFNLGVEGDTATNIEAFARFGWYKERIAKHKEQYKLTQEETMDVIRRELEFKKRPKAERTEEEEHTIDEQKAQTSDRMEKVKMALEMLSEEFEQMLQINTVEVKGKVFTHVTIQYGDERVTTKRVHGPSVFTFNQYEIQMSSKLDEEDIGI